MTITSSPADRAQRLSPWALLALLCSGCPFTAILGLVLAVWALRDLSLRPDRRGRGFAFGAIVVSLAMTTVTVVFARHWHINVRVPMQAGPAEPLRWGLAGDVGLFQEGFLDPDGRATAGEAALFLTQVSDRYGNLLEIRQDVDAPPRDPASFTPNQLSIPYVFVFEQAVVKGDAGFRAFGGPLDLDPMWTWIHLSDDDLGDLSYPAFAAPAPPPTLGSGEDDPGAVDG